MQPKRNYITAQDAEPPFFVGVDLGGTNIKVGLVDNLGRPLSWHSFPTEVERGPDNAAQRMGQAVLRAAADAKIAPEHVAQVGLGSPGTMDVPAGKLIEPPNLPGWFYFPIRDAVSAACGRPVTFVNDGNAAAYGEFWVGRGRDYKSMVLLTLGTGVGGGIIVGDRLIDGEHSHGGECGHIIIDLGDHARRCNCGHTGHLEAYASATALTRRAQEALMASEKKSSLRERIAAGEELSPLLVAKQAEQGDDLSLWLVLETARYLGVGVVSLMHTIDPNGVVIGGAMNFGGAETTLGQRFLERVREEVHKRALPVPGARCEIEFASLGGDAGYIGAAGVARLAWQRAQRRKQ